MTGGTAHFHLHGVPGYRYRHTEADLGHLRDAAAPFATADCLFNNMTMLEDAPRLQALVEDCAAG